MKRHETSTITAENCQGVLVEFRFSGSPTLSEALEFRQKAAAIVRQVVEREKRKAILCTDLRSCGVLAPEVSDVIIGLMQADNPHIERNAFLGSEKGVLSLQTRRIIQEAGDTSRRRMFMSEAPLIQWLSEVTNASEQARLALFLSAPSRP